MRSEQRPPISEPRRKAFDEQEAISSRAWRRAKRGELSLCSHDREVLSFSGHAQGAHGLEPATYDRMTPPVADFPPLHGVLSRRANEQGAATLVRVIRCVGVDGEHDRRRRGEA
jgi:hypothetical protein